MQPAPASRALALDAHDAPPLAHLPQLLEDGVPDNPFLSFLGVRLVAWEDGYSEFELPLRPVLLNRQGMLQGGVLSTLLDVACGYAGLHAVDDQPVRHGHTVSLSLQYLNKATHGTVRAKGFLVQQGGTLFFARGEAWLDGRLLLATAQGTFKCRSTRR